HKILTYNYPDNATNKPNKAAVILGTRSALFLPYKNLGLIIVDEEHDTSYKQTEPSPRYHARDAAIMLANIHKAKILLGSATPSFESEYNCEINRFTKVELNEKFYGAVNPNIEIVDTIKARKTRQMVGNFSQKLINEIRKTIVNNGQVLIFRNRRSYSPIVECTECGTIPKCPHCNVYLSYHKYDNTLRCHYCDYVTEFNGICTKCGLNTLKYKGAGTEKLEEELKQLFPDKNIARYDADIAKSKRIEEQVIKDFANGKIDILIGTQMISKGFDFEKLNLVAVMQADTILGVQDFRGDERALQLFNQLMGRTGRRGIRGKLIIQTNQKEHPIFEQLLESQYLANDAPNTLITNILLERKEFNFAPYVRMIKIIVKHRDAEKLDILCSKISNLLIACEELTGPFIPTIDRIRGEYIKCFYVKFARNNKLAHNKTTLQKAIESLHASNSIILDVDPF
ncbi:MAG: primosomal protein N', partial [Bacteroidales bacterium]